MAGLQRRPTANGDAWRVSYRVDGRMRSDTLFTIEDALRHRALVDRLGGEAARAVLHAREAAWHGVVESATITANA